MASLSEHLSDAEKHASLSCHPARAICRDERLAGMLAARPIFSLRTRAAVAAAVLATAAIGQPAAAVATPEADHDQEGQVAPESGGPPGDSAHGPDFDPGGPGDVLGEEAPAPAPTDETVDQGDTGAIDGEPGLGPTDVPPEPEQDPLGPVVPDNSAAPLDAPPAAQEPVAPKTEPTSPKPETPKKVRTGDKRIQVAQGQAAPKRFSPSQPAGNSSTSGTHVDSSVQAVAAANSAPPEVAPSAGGGRVHIVQRGESLWSIAADLLGPGASAGEIAREVHRLWRLNADRIASGKPDLISVGLKLRIH